MNVLNTRIVIGALLFVGLLFTSAFSISSDNESNTAHEGQKENMKEIKLEEGLQTVIDTVEKLKIAMNKTTPDIKEVNRLGKSLNDNWDSIEKKVEEKYPEDYENIEESLYPLISNTIRQDEMDVKEIKKLTDDTLSKILEFQEKIS